MNVMSWTGEKTLKKGIEGADAPDDTDHIVFSAHTSIEAGLESLTDAADFIDSGSQFSITISDELPSEDTWEIGDITSVDIKEENEKTILSVGIEGIEAIDERTHTIIESVITEETIKNGLVTWTTAVPITGIKPGDTLSIETPIKQAKCTQQILVDKINYSGSETGFSMSFSGAKII